MINKRTDNAMINTILSFKGVSFGFRFQKPRIHTGYEFPGAETKAASGLLGTQNLHEAPDFRVPRNPY